MINRIKELFETNPKSMWTISFLLLVIFIFTPVLKSEYKHYKYRAETAISDFEWKEIQRTNEERKKERETVKDQYTVVFLHTEDDYDMDENGNMFPTRWLWFNIPEAKKNIIFNYNGKDAVDNRGTPLVKGETYTVSQNVFGEVIDIDRH